MVKLSHKKSNNNNNKKSSFKKKTIEDYVFYIGSNKQASDYEVTVEFILNHFKMTCQDSNDIAESIEKETKKIIASKEIVLIASNLKSYQPSLLKTSFSFIVIL